MDCKLADMFSKPPGKKYLVKNHQLIDAMYNRVNVGGEYNIRATYTDAKKLALLSSELLNTYIKDGYGGSNRGSVSIHFPDGTEICLF